MKKAAIIFSIVSLNATHLLCSQAVNKKIDDKVILNCLEKLFASKHFESKKGIVSVSDIKPEAGEQRVLVVSTFLVDREAIDVSIGQVIGNFKENVVIYKSFKEKGSRKSAIEVEKMRDSLDDYLLGNKAAYVANEKRQEEGFILGDGTRIKFDKPKSKRVVYVRGFDTKFTIKSNGAIEISYF